MRRSDRRRAVLVAGVAVWAVCAAPAAAQVGPVQVSPDVSPCTFMLLHQEAPAVLNVDSSQPQQGSGSTSVCVSTGPSSGVRLTVEGVSSPVTYSDDLSPCSYLVFDQEVPDLFRVDTSPPGAPGPVSVCVTLKTAGYGFRLTF